MKVTVVSESGEHLVMGDVVTTFVTDDEGSVKTAAAIKDGKLMIAGPEGDVSKVLEGAVGIDLNRDGKVGS